MTEHPVDQLMNEHRVIERVLDSIERELRRLRGGEKLREEFWGKVTSFIVQFADRCHHGKEEDLLFPALESAGLPADHGPTAVMRQEHIEGRDLTKWIVAATEAGDRDEVFACAKGYVELLREHIAKEDTILFAMAKQLLDFHEVERLRKDFAALDRTIGEETITRLVSIADELATETTATN